MYLNPCWMQSSLLSWPAGPHALVLSRALLHPKGLAIQGHLPQDGQTLNTYWHLPWFGRPLTPPFSHRLVSSEIFRRPGAWGVASWASSSGGCSVLLVRSEGRLDCCFTCLVKRVSSVEVPLGWDGRATLPVRLGSSCCFSANWALQIPTFWSLIILFWTTP